MVETPHMKTKKELVAKTVIMSGDPLRTKFIAENYLTDYVLINEVRGMLAYTGYYKGKKITLATSGMGMPSMGIYAYELYNFFDVENIIRIGSAGSFNKNVEIMDIVLSDTCYTEGNFAYNFDNKQIKNIESSKELDNLIINKAKEMNQEIKYGRTFCAECFDPYLATDEYRNRMPEDILAVEMEAFSLFYTAKHFNRKASCLLTVADNIVNKKAISSEQRQKALTDMIELALEVAICC